MTKCQWYRHFFEFPTFPVTVLFNWNHIYLSIFNAVYSQQLAAPLNNVRPNTSCFGWNSKGASPRFEMGHVGIKFTKSCSHFLASEDGQRFLNLIHNCQNSANLTEHILMGLTKFLVTSNIVNMAPANKPYASLMSLSTWRTVLLPLNLSKITLKLTIFGAQLLYRTFAHTLK